MWQREIREAIENKSDLMRAAWCFARLYAQKLGGKPSEYISYAMKTAWARWTRTQILPSCKIIKETDKAVFCSYVDIFTGCDFVERWIPKSVITMINGEVAVTDHYDLERMRFGAPKKVVFLKAS